MREEEEEREEMEGLRGWRQDAPADGRIDPAGHRQDSQALLEEGDQLCAGVAVCSAVCISRVWGCWIQRAWGWPWAPQTSWLHPDWNSNSCCAIRGCPGVGDEPGAHLHTSSSPLSCSVYRWGIQLFLAHPGSFSLCPPSHPALAPHSSTFFPFPCYRTPKWRRDSGCSSIWPSPSSS